jgi:tetratricopeptide (TPR) repeat protein
MRLRLVFLLGIICGLISTVTAQDRSAEIWSHIDYRFDREMNLLYEDGNFPLVVEMLKVQLSYDPKNYDTFTNLGWMLENIERFDEAEKLYKQFQADYPKSSDGAYPLGYFYYMRKRYQDCINVLEPSLKLKPTPHPNTFRLLGKSYERLNKFNDAIRVWQLQLKAYPKDGPAKVNIDRVKAKLKSAGG